MLPRLCFGCNARLYRGEQLICTLCRNQLPVTGYTFSEENAVDRIFYGRVEIKKASGFLFYTDHGIVKNLIHYLKYKNQETIGIFLGDWYGAILKASGDLTVDYVIPVPLHTKKIRKRGYNQVSEFAKRLAFHLGATYLDTVLIKTANTKTQTRKNRIYRWLGGRELYALSDPSLLQGDSVLLVDDVITTGSTMEACATALHQCAGITINISAMAVVP
jgi:ComF family protein